MSRVPPINRNQRRAGQRTPRQSSRGYINNWFHSWSKKTPEFENGLVTNLWIEIGKFRETLALTPLQFFGAILGAIATGIELYEGFQKYVLGAESGGVGAGNSGGIFTALASSMDGSTIGLLLIYFLFACCISWMCVLILLVLTLWEGEFLTIFGHFVTVVIAWYVLAWSHNLFKTAANAPKEWPVLATPLLILSAVIIFTFIAKTQFKLTKETLTKIQLRRVNFILTFIIACIIAAALETGVLNA